MLIDLYIRDVTALVGRDYALPTSMSLTFDPTVPNMEITIDIIADNSKEDTEIFEIYIEASSSTDVIVGPDIAVINIEDASAKSKLINLYDLPFLNLWPSLQRLISAIYLMMSCHSCPFFARWVALASEVMLTLCKSASRLWGGCLPLGWVPWTWV